MGYNSRNIVLNFLNSLGQTWGFGFSGDLENDCEGTYGDMFSWTIPAEHSEDYIEDQVTGQVLGLKDDSTVSGTEVIWESKDIPISVYQTWLRVPFPNIIGTFIMINPYSGKTLTVIEGGYKFIIKGNDNSK